MSARHLEQNAALLNRASWRWLRVVHEDTPPHHLHVLSLAAWGLEVGIDAEWPPRDRHAVEEQVALLFGGQPDSVFHWLVSNPIGPSRSEQAHDLLVAVQGMQSPESAAAVVLSVIYSRYSRQQAENRALQP